MSETKIPKVGGIEDVDTYVILSGDAEPTGTIAECSMLIVIDAASGDKTYKMYKNGSWR